MSVTRSQWRHLGEMTLHFDLGEPTDVLRTERREGQCCWFECGFLNCLNGFVSYDWTHLTEGIKNSISVISRYVMGDGRKEKQGRKARKENTTENNSKNCSISPPEQGHDRKINNGRKK